MDNNIIYMFLEEYIGLDIESISKKCLDGIIVRWLKKEKLTDVSQLFILLKKKKELLNAFLDDVVVKETWFFRDKSPFLFLRENINSILTKKFAGKINVLSIPCSTGEEPYSIFITFLESGLNPRNFNIDAVDISSTALNKAKKGYYRKISFREKEFDYLYKKYFTKFDNQYLIDKNIVNKINFYKYNIIKDNMKKINAKYDIIFCRNLLIYLNETGKIKLVNLLKNYLSNNGMLFVGHTEMNYFKQKGFNIFKSPGSFALSKNIEIKPVKETTQIRQNNMFIKSQKNIIVKKDIIKEQEPVIDIDIIRSLADAGDLVNAAKKCEDYIKLNKTDSEAYFLLGTIYGAMKKIEKSEENYLKSLYLNPAHYESAHHLHFLYEQQGNFQKAEVFLKKAVNGNKR